MGFNSSFKFWGFFVGNFKSYKLVINILFYFLLKFKKPEKARLVLPFSITWFHWDIVFFLNFAHIWIYKNLYRIIFWLSLLYFIVNSMKNEQKSYHTSVDKSK